MIKRSLIIFFVLISIIPVAGQVRHDVVSSAGSFSTSGDISLSWTLGETVIPTQQAGDVILTHGFQQQLVLSTLEKMLDLEVDLVVYPNPASDILNLRFGTAVKSPMQLFIMDQEGRLVKTESIEAGVIVREINMQDLSSGIYYLRLIKGKLSNVYKVVKL